MLNYHEKFIVIEEKVDLQQKLISSSENEKWISPENIWADTTLIRNLKTDTFHLELGIYNHSKIGEDFPYVVINNEIYHTGEKDNFLYNYQDKNYKKWFKYIVPYPAIKNTKFHDLNVAVFGVDNKKIAPYIHFLIAPKFEPLPKYVDLKNDQILLIKTIKKIVFNIKNNMFNDFNNKKQNLVPRVSIYYNYIYIVPQKLSQTKNNETLFKIYLKNDDDSKFYNDFMLDDGILRTNSTNKPLQFYLKNYKIDNTKKHFGNHYATFLGDINIANSLMYDYDKKCVVEDFGENSALGDLIPFNFKGNFKREAVLNINQSFKNFKIRLFQKIEQALLNVDDGMIDLKIINSDEHLKYSKMIKQSNIQFIKKRLKQKNFEYFSLTGIDKLSETIK